MTAPMSPSPARVGDDRAGGATTFDAEMRAALAAGEPNLDNVTDPDVIGAYGLEPDGDQDQDECVRTASCEADDHTYSWPCEHAPGTGARR